MDRRRSVTYSRINFHGAHRPTANGNDAAWQARA